MCNFFLQSAQNLQKSVGITDLHELSIGEVISLEVDRMIIQKVLVLMVIIRCEMFEGVLNVNKCVWMILYQIKFLTDIISCLKNYCMICFFFFSCIIYFSHFSFINLFFQLSKFLSFFFTIIVNVCNFY